MLGGGPAGVVELPSKDAVGLLVGVVAFACEVFEPKLKLELPPVLAAPPNRFGFGV